jgi:type 1 glutamine amidotransferase
MTINVHLIIGGYPRGALAGHDMDYARLRLLQFLAEQPDVVTTIAADFTDIDQWLADAQFLITYVAGPYPNEQQNDNLHAWLEQGGRWFGLHGTSGGKAQRVEGGRAMVKTSHHQTLGGFFLNHPPLCRVKVQVNGDHPLARDLPASFEVDDELYLLEMQGDHQVLLTTEIDKDPSPPGFGFVYDKDTSAQADGRTRVLGFSRDVGKGAVTYIALGHCHSPASNSQPFVDDSVNEGGATPGVFHGAWETAEFQQLIRNAIAWGIQAA